MRTQAVTWVMRQVSRAEVVGCDAQVYAELLSRGFPGASLLKYGPQSNDPLGAGLVVDTAAVRAQFRDRLAVWAPAIIAAFGSGNARIEIRLEFPGGATAYRAVQQKYARARKLIDAQLLTNRSIKLSATAKTQLRSGKIDPRLPELLALMVHFHPLQIVDFGDQLPGGGPASPRGQWTWQRRPASAPYSFGIHQLDAVVHQGAAIPISPCREPGHAAYRPNRTEDRVRRAEPAQPAIQLTPIRDSAARGSPG